MVRRQARVDAVGRIIAPIFLLIFLGAEAACAQSFAMTQLYDATGTGLGQKAEVAFARSLQDKGARVFAPNAYLRAASQQRIPAGRVFDPQSVATLSGAMGFDALVSGSVERRGGRVRLTVVLVGSNGELIKKKSYKLKKASISAKIADKVASFCMNNAGLRSRGNALANAVEPPPPPAPASSAPWAPSVESREPFAIGDEGAELTVKKKGKKSHQGNNTSSVDDLLLYAGVTINFRSGLKPAHEMSTPLPGLEIGGQLYLGRFSRGSFLENLGLEGVFNWALPAKYGADNLDKTYTSNLTQWSLGLDYRVPFSVLLTPTLVARGGVSSVSCGIDADVPNIFSVSYLGPYLGAALHVTPWAETLRVFAAFDYLLMVKETEDLKASGSGMHLAVGATYLLSASIAIDAGYEMTSLSLSTNVNSKPESMSDKYSGFFVRAGWRI